MVGRLLLGNSYSPSISSNNAVQFDGSTQYGEVANYAGLAGITGDFTVEGWYWKNTSGGSYELAWQFYDTVAPGTTAYLQTESAAPSTGVNFATMYSGTPEADGYTPSGIFDLSTWVHVGFVHNSTTKKTHIYKNGVQISYNLQQTATGTPLGFANSKLRIAAREGMATNEWNGKMACMRVWNVMRTAAQLADNKGYYLDPSQETGLIMNLNFGNGSGSTVTNDAPSSNNMTLTASPTWVTGPSLSIKPGYGGRTLAGERMTLKPWTYEAVDLQVVTKDNTWNQSQAKRLAEYQAVKDLGITHAALAVPYDDPTKYGNYITDARTKGLKVYHRSHWNAWEGDNGSAANMTKANYLSQTATFITDHPTFFEDGDLFGMCVEANNANDAPHINTAYPFRVGNVVGGAFDFTQYNQFLKDQVSVANTAFTTIGKNVPAWAVSMSVTLLNLAGQTLDATSGNASGLTNADIVQYFGGVLTIDHYMSDTYRSNTAYGDKYRSDLDKIHIAFPSCKIMIGEIGYPTNTALSDAEQLAVYDQIVNVLISKPYIIGVNFWVHMASNTASLFNDVSGTITVPGRPATKAVTRAFNQTRTRTLAA